MLKYYERFNSRNEAAKREKEIKGWRKEKKLKLIKQFTLSEKVHSEHSEKFTLSISEARP
ncbi:MAG: hypothetical protein AAB371_03305 [Patescibacteria group bacterium]